MLKRFPHFWSVYNNRSADEFKVTDNGEEFDMNLYSLPWVALVKTQCK